MVKSATRSAPSPPATRPQVRPTKAAPKRISGLIARGFDAGRLKREAFDLISG